MKNLNKTFLRKLAISSALLLAVSIVITTQTKAIDINSFDQLRDAINNAFGDNVTLEIQSNLSNSTANNNLGIHGNGATLIVDALISEINGADGEGTAKGITINGGSKLNINAGVFKRFSSTEGAAILNLESSTTNITGSTFRSNTATEYGGAIDNAASSNLVLNNATFGGVAVGEGNSAQNGGALYNVGTANITDSTFTGNTASDNGGAIYNTSDGIMFFGGNTSFSENEAYLKGGAICNEGLIIFNGNTSFSGNSISSKGGAIYNEGENANIIFNKAVGFDNNISTVSSGGAIFNNSTMTFKDAAIFTGNSTKISNGGAIDNNMNGVMTFDGPASFVRNSSNSNGGAIYNAVGKMYFNNSTSFADNNAKSSGGAIYNKQGHVYLNGDARFSNNTAKGNLNDIYNDGGLYINGTTTLHGGVDGAGTTKVGNGATIKILDNYDGTVKMKQQEVYFGEALNPITSTINMQNNAINIIDFANSNLHIYDNLNLYLDADLANSKIDSITALGLIDATDSKINIQGINIIKDAVTDIITTNAITDNPELLAKINYVGTTSADAYSPVHAYKYDIAYNKDDGSFNFHRRINNSGGSDGYNPAVLPAPIAANVGSYATALNGYDYGLKYADNFMNLSRFDRMAIKNRNVYAIVDNSNIQYHESENKGVWFTPYTSFESINLNNGPKVNSISYGSYFGGDTDFISLGKGWDVVYSGYAGYNGSHQSYSGVGINQNGGSLGATATFFKDNYFLGTTLNVGASHGEASTMYGLDTFATLNAGIAAKTGYNFEFNQGKFIIQPSLLMSYTFINTFDYTNAVGVKISSQPLNAINLAPALKFIANTKNGWQPYVNLRMVWNFLDKTNFTAQYAGQSTKLPQMSIAPYFQYGLGVQKRAGERITGFAEAMVNSGGRNGIALQFGFKYKLGKERL